MIVSTSDCPGAIVGTLQMPPVTGVPEGVNEVPPAAEADTYVTFAGSVSVTSTPVAVAVPLFRSVTV